MEVEFASKQQQELMEYLTPKLTEEELKHVVFLLTQHNLENYTVGFTKASIKNTHPFFTTKECIDILEELDGDDWCWSYVQEALQEHLYTPPAYEKYIEELIKQEIVPPAIWDNLWFDTKDTIDNIIDCLDQDDVYEYKETRDASLKEKIFKVIRREIRNEIVDNCDPIQLIEVAKDAQSNFTDEDISSINKFLTDYYKLSSIEIAKLWAIKLINPQT